MALEKGWFLRTSTERFRIYRVGSQHVYRIERQTKIGETWEHSGGGCATLSEVAMWRELEDIQNDGWFYLSKGTRFKVYVRGDGWRLLCYEQRFAGSDWELWYEGPVNPAENAMWAALQRLRGGKT